METVCVASYHDYANQGDIKVLKTIAPSVAAIGNGRGKGVLLIDDLTDTGKTAKLVREMLPDAHFATVYAKPAGAPMCHTFITEVSQDTWIYFPWDLDLRYVEPISDGARRRIRARRARSILRRKRATALTPAAGILTVAGLAARASCQRVAELEKLFIVLIGMAVGLWLAGAIGTGSHPAAWPESQWPKLQLPRLQWPTPKRSAPAPRRTSGQLHADCSPRQRDSRSRRSPRGCTLWRPCSRRWPPTYAHPRELEDQPQFAEAVKLLEDPDVPLDTVMQYALGANWPLACAGLAALSGAADRSERADEVVAHFEKLYPWPIHFALDVSRRRRAAAGRWEIPWPAPRTGGATI